MGVCYGDETLEELRISFLMSDSERYGGIVNRIHPLTDVTKCGNTIKRCGYTVPTIFKDKIIYEMENLSDIF